MKQKFRWIVLQSIRLAGKKFMRVSAPSCKIKVFAVFWVHVVVLLPVPINSTAVVKEPKGGLEKSGGRRNRNRIDEDETSKAESKVVVVTHQTTH